MSSRSLYQFLIKKGGFKEVSINNRKHVSWGKWIGAGV